MAHTNERTICGVVKSYTSFADELNIVIEEEDGTLMPVRYDFDSQYLEEAVD